jgi:hypothetical protein
MTLPTSQETTSHSLATFLDQLRVRDLASLSGLTLEEVASIAMDAKTQPEPARRGGAGLDTEPLRHGVVGALSTFRRANPRYRVSLGRGSIQGGIDIRVCQGPPDMKSLRGRTVRLTDIPLTPLADGLVCARAGLVLGGRRRACAILFATSQPQLARTFLLFDRRPGRDWRPEEIENISRMKVVALFADFVGKG